MDSIRRREDTDGCACIRCRSVDPRIFRQSLGGDLLTGTALLGRHPSVAVGVFVALLLTGLLNPLWTQIGQPVSFIDIPAEGVFFLGVLAVVVRTYAVTMFSASMSDQILSTRELVRHSVARLPAVSVTLAIIVVTSFVALGLASAGASVLFAIALAVEATTGIALAVDSIFSGASATLIFGSVMALVAFKFWLAPEICVAGGYGPLTALWLSWSLTPAHRLRILVVVVGFGVTAFGGDLFTGMLAATGAETGPDLPGLALVGFVAQGLCYVIWFAVGTQIYFRGVVDL
jgi:hypothetical protein